MSSRIQSTKFHITQYLQPNYWNEEKMQDVDFEDDNAVKKKIYQNLEILTKSYTDEELKAIGLSVKMMKDKDAFKGNPIVKFACIIHDKDVQIKTKIPKDRHIHIFVEFEKKLDLKRLAKIVGVEPQYIETAKRGKYGTENLLAYLIHAKDKTKFQYRPEEVETFDTFNYLDYEAEHRETWKNYSYKATANKEDETLPMLLEKVREGEINRDTLLYTPDYLRVYQRHLIEFEGAFNGYLVKAEALVRQAMLSGQLKLTTLYVFGQPSAGKSKFSEALANQIIKNVKGCQKWSTYITAASNPTDEYTGEEIIIFDDLRPQSMSWENWLKILDPDRLAKSSARYHNKTLTAHLIIINAPMPPETFFRQIAKDDLAQAMRRLTLAIEIIYENAKRSAKIYDIKRVEHKPFIQLSGAFPMLPPLTPPVSYERQPHYKANVPLSKARDFCISILKKRDKTINKKPPVKTSPSPTDDTSL